MNQYNSYYLYQQFEKRGSQDWLPCYPNIFSVDGDGTMPLVMKKENDPDCGYTGDTEPIYRWYPLPISTDYICDECPVVQYRWHNMDVSTDYYCDTTTYTKYYKQIRQYSYDSGTTWYDVTPPEYQQGGVYEQQSTDCGYVPPIEPQYRTTSGTPYCEGVDKYVDVYSQVSYDGGITWETTATAVTLVERNSQDCGYSPMPSNAKMRLSYINSVAYTAACDSNTTLTSGDTRPAGYTYSSMTSAEIGDCVTSIGVNALRNSSGLTSIDIPSGVTSIGASALTYCSGLTSITMEATTPPTLGTKAFDYTNGCPIIVNTCDLVSTYKSASGWSSYASRIISMDCPKLTSRYNVVSTSKPTRISYDTSSLSYMEVDGTMIIRSTGYTFSTTGEHMVNYLLPGTSIANSAFTYCSGMTSVVIPDSVTSIGDYVFRDCRGLTSCTIGSGVTSIGTRAFTSCSGLTSINIPSGVTRIGGWAFENCSSLTSVTIGSGVTSIGSYSFAWCSGITSVVIPDSVTTVGKYAFEWCTSLTSCTIGSGVTSIDTYAFYRCSGLTSMTCLATTPPTLGSDVFYGTNNCPIYVPSGSVNTYKSDYYWSTYSSRIQAIP